MAGRPAMATNGAVATTRPTSMKRRAFTAATSEVPVAHDDGDRSADEAGEDPGAQQRPDGTHQRPDPAADEPAEDDPAQQQHARAHPACRIARWRAAHERLWRSFRSSCVITPTRGRAP